MESEVDRRKIEREFTSVLKQCLNDEQLATLLQLERFGWILTFVRQPRNSEPVPAVLDPDNDEYAVLDADGSLNKDPPLQFRE
jgi:hypothetical protein